MQRKLLATYILVIAVTVIVTLVFSWTSVYNHFYDQVEVESDTQLKLLTRIFGFEYAREDFDFQEFASSYGTETGLRITIISGEGLVLADSISNPELMENHKNRDEFRSALRGTPKKNIRYSNTLSMYMFYNAVSLIDVGFDGAIRVALPVESINELIWQVANSVIIGIIIGFLLSFIIAYLMTNRFMSPINELTKTAKLIASGDYDNKVYIDNQDQIGAMAEAFNTMTFTMRKNIWEIETKNAELESILTSMDAGIAAIDENYQIILCNEPFINLLALEGEVEGKVFYEVTRNTVLFSLIEKSIDENEFITEETKVKNNGEEILIKVSATPIRDKNDRSIRYGVLLSLENITTLRKLENIRRDFVSNVTHELKTPLTSIKGFVDLLKKGDVDDEATKTRFLEIIDIETERLTALIEDILSLSEIESMRLDKKTGYYHVGDIVGEVKEIIQFKADSKNIKLISEVQSDLPEINCNFDRMKQLLINLVDNAVKYTEEGSVTIECKASRDGKYLQLNVIDTGIGIEEEHLERLFERFYRVDKGRSRKMGGTGLGLSIVKHIVELYNGSIDVSSVFGQGTKMKIRIPFDID